tara:strand:- start:407 stop:577 length:171 start_codon:yes stop_codon:yes gene_type:complete
MEKENNLDIRTIDIFNGLTDEDFVKVHKAGQLKNLCYALTLDLQPKINGKDNPYST